MNWDNSFQGRGPNAPQVGLLDMFLGVLLAFAIGYAFYNALMFFWEN